MFSVFALVPALMGAAAFLDKTPSTTEGEDALTVALGEDVSIPTEEEKKEK